MNKESLTQENNKTWLGVVVAIFMVAPAFVPATLVVIVYSFFLRFYLSDGESRAC